MLDEPGKSDFATKSMRNYIGTSSASPCWVDTAGVEQMTPKCMIWGLGTMIVGMESQLLCNGV